MRDSRRGAEVAMQSMLDVLERWHRLLHVWTLLARWYNRNTISTFRPFLISSLSRTFT